MANLERCRSCHAPIHWVTTEAGKLMPLDGQTSEDGCVIIRMGPKMGQETAHVETKEERAARQSCPEPAGRTAYTPHWATCPDAQSWRKKKA